MFGACSAPKIGVAQKLVRLLPNFSRPESAGVREPCSAMCNPGITIGSYCGQNGIALLDSTPFSSFRRVDKLHLGHTGCIPIDHVCDGVIDHPGILGIHDETDCAQVTVLAKTGSHNIGLEDMSGQAERDPYTLLMNLTAALTLLLAVEELGALTEDGVDVPGEVVDVVAGGEVVHDFYCFYMPHDEEGCGNCTGVWEAMATYIAGHLADNEYEYPYANEEGVYGFTCNTGECTSNFFFCDDRLTSFGCADLQDEQGCEDVRCLGRKCEETHKCGPFSLDTCDGVPDCLDLTEEKNCAMFRDRLPCIRSNRFISRNHICDGIPDCADASDEDACIEHRANDISCGEGWAIFEEHCYQKFSSPLVWWAAENYCQALDGHLVAVNTPQENEFLRGNIGNGWIGMKIGAVLIKRERQKIDNFTWSDGSPVGDAYKDQSISIDFLEYSWKLNDPFCGFLEDHGPWSLQPCSLIEKEFICEKDPSSYRGDGCETTANYNYTDLQNVEETGLDELHVYIPDMTVCDDCMARKTVCGNIRCGSPDQYRCGLIYSPGYPTAFPRSVICLWTIDGPRGSFVTLLLLDVDLPGYSGDACTSRVLQVRDRFLTVGWNTIHGLCRDEGEQKRYLSSSNEMRLAMLATSHNADFGDSRGFMATFNISTFSTSRQVKNLPDDAGLQDIYLNRTFTWTDGIPVTYMDWSPMDTRTWLPQPDGAKINFCVAIVMKNVWGTDQWYDVACDDRATRSFICKLAAERVTRPGDNA
ncbi:LRP1B [Branchiostoma lanceolatum]|uniref:LRP1B protein n=1 Tax=Branchiostoma lanceolatum TaxID=7740 RepID=A0A8J9ZTP5_BRALA|nr:LRP1B [Branchiostoma lanceolatum]